MNALDMTNELAPLIWTIEGMMLVAVVWLVAMFFAEQPNRINLHGLNSSVTPRPEPPNPGLPYEGETDTDRRLAA